MAAEDTPAPILLPGDAEDVPQALKTFSWRLVKRRSPDQQFSIYCKNGPQFNAITQYCLEHSLDLAINSNAPEVEGRFAVVITHSAAAYLRILQKKLYEKFKNGNERVVSFFVPTELMDVMRPRLQPLCGENGVELTEQPQPTGGVHCVIQRAQGDGPRRVCCFYLQHRCKAGVHCINSHEDDGKTPCTFGAKCHDNHYLRGGGVPDQSPAPPHPNPRKPPRQQRFPVLSRPVTQSHATMQQHMQHHNPIFGYPPPMAHGYPPQYHPQQALQQPHQAPYVMHIASGATYYSYAPQHPMPAPAPQPEHYPSHVSVVYEPAEGELSYTDDAEETYAPPQPQHNAPLPRPWW